MRCNCLAAMGVHILLKGVILGCSEVPLRVLHLDVLQYCPKVLSQTKRTKYTYQILVQVTTLIESVDSNVGIGQYIKISPNLKTVNL